MIYLDGGFDDNEALRVIIEGYMNDSSYDDDRLVSKLKQAGPGDSLYDIFIQKFEQYSTDQEADNRVGYQIVDELSGSIVAVSYGSVFLRSGSLEVKNKESLSTYSLVVDGATVSGEHNDANLTFTNGALENLGLGSSSILNININSDSSLNGIISNEGTVNLLNSTYDFFRRPFGL